MVRPKAIEYEKWGRKMGSDTINASCLTPFYALYFLASLPLRQYDLV